MSSTGTNFFLNRYKQNNNIGRNNNEKRPYTKSSKLPVAKKGSGDVDGGATITPSKNSMPTIKLTSIPVVTDRQGIEETDVDGTTTTTRITTDNGSSIMGGLLVLEGLIESEDWNGIARFLESSPDAAKKVIDSAKSPLARFKMNDNNDRNNNDNNKQLSSHAAVGNYLLHILCSIKRTPLSLINTLLELNEDAIRIPGQHGYLPLHCACSAGVSLSIVTRLLDVYPAATRCRDEFNGSLPLHLAARYGSSEEIVMEMLCVYPEGSFMRDQDGKTPADYAKLMPEQETACNILYVLETAPILVETAKSASMRVQNDYESRLRGMQDAHKEFIRQLEVRQEQERQQFMQMEVQFHNELAEEKERNINFAEIILDLQVKENQLTADVSEAENLLKMERDENKARVQAHDKQLKSILFNRPLKGVYGEEDAHSKSQPVSALLKDFVTKFEEIQSELMEFQQQEDMVRHLNQLLCSKDKEMHDLNVKLSEKEAAETAASKSASEFEKLHNDTQNELDKVQKENEQLRKAIESQQRQLQEAERIRNIHENRMGSVKNLVSSLSYNVESWNIDDICSGVEAGVGTSFHMSTPIKPTHSSPPVALVGIETVKTGKDGDDKSRQGPIHPSKRSESPDHGSEEGGTTCTATVSSKASAGDDDASSLIRHFISSSIESSPARTIRSTDFSVPEP